MICSTVWLPSPPGCIDHNVLLADLGIDRRSAIEQKIQVSTAAGPVLLRHREGTSSTDRFVMGVVGFKDPIRRRIVDQDMDFVPAGREHFEVLVVFQNKRSENGIQASVRIQGPVPAADRGVGIDGRKKCVGNIQSLFGLQHSPQGKRQVVFGRR